MMTPELERLVLSNQAVVRTHNHGVGGVGTILVPPGRMIIITQIIWHPFVDINDTVSFKDKTFDFSGSFLHTLKLRNKMAKYAFSFRDTFRTAFFNSPAKTIFYPENCKVIDTYLPFTDGNVQIGIMKFTNFYDWIVYSDTMPTPSLEPAPAEGYGTPITPTAFRVPQSVSYYGPVPPPYLPENYFPPTKARGLGNNPNGTDEFEGTIPLTNPPNYAALPPEPHPANTDVSMFPMITFTYVELTGRYIPGELPKGTNPNKKR
jgi:hypothetical protein